VIFATIAGIFDRLRWEFATIANNGGTGSMPRQPGLDGRHRDSDGEIRRKNGNTRIDSLRETYGASFAEGLRANMKLETLLERVGAKSLSDYLKGH
jgi:hypothetical protein